MRLLGLCLLALPLVAQEGYRTPPEVVRQILDAERLPGLDAAPDGSRFLLLSSPAMPSIAELSRPMLQLAGQRIDPSANGPFVTRYVNALALLTPDGRRTDVALPPGARVSPLGWSPDGARYAVTMVGDSGTSLWMVNADASLRQVTGPVLNAVLGSPCQWVGNARMLCRLVPANRAAPPAPPIVPAGPIVQRNEGRTAPVRTFQDLLSSPHDEAVFAHYATSQVAWVSIPDGAVTPVGTPAIHLDAEASPDGSLILATIVERPFSYLVPVWGFPQRIEVWLADGRRAHTLANVPLADEVPIGGVRTGPRNVEWRPDQPAVLVWVEALDGGDTRRPADERDKVMMVAAPFTAPVEVFRTGARYAGIRWGHDGLMLVSEYERSTRRMMTWMLTPDDPATRRRLVFDYATEDRYASPGTPVMTRNAAGRSVLLRSRDGDWIFLTGPGASPEGDRPFLDRMRLRDGRTQRLFHSGANAYEVVVEVLDQEGRRLVTRRESRTEPPNYFLATPRDEAAPRRPLTRITNPAPALADLRRELVTYQRADGVGLSGTLYYPTGYQDGQQVPVVFWIYPSEFASADAASQVRGSPNRFVLPGGASHLFLLTQGYAVLDNPTLPVVGGDSANDTYVEQTVAGAQAAIDYLTQRGIADGRFGVGGHSYGAFATANLLAHSDLFRAGIARSGAYNRTLTPFGFQAEQRSFWEARDVYLEMMPFTYANQINEPILLIHGMNDNNSGTFPIQSERMYMALKGHGATVEYVQLPFESHGYAARESVMDVLARMISWMDRYVKGERERT